MSTGSAAGWVVVERREHAQFETEITIAQPPQVYLSREAADRERDRAQSHADIDADLSDFRVTYIIAEICGAEIRQEVQEVIAGGDTG